MTIKLIPIPSSGAKTTYAIYIDGVNFGNTTENEVNEILFTHIPKVVVKESQVHPFNKSELDVIERALGNQKAYLVYNTLVTLIKYRSQFPVSSTNVQQT